MKSESTPSKTKLTKKQCETIDDWFDAHSFLPWTDNRNESDCFLVMHQYSVQPIVAYYCANTKAWIEYHSNKRKEIFPSFFKKLPGNPIMHGLTFLTSIPVNEL